jgi:cytosine/adenosine deaminase-related metal-dependent hydrolase
VIVRARAVVPMNGPTMLDAAIAVRGSRITAAGRLADIKAGHSGNVLDTGDCALLPGLINMHCHLDYTGLRGCIARQPSFAGWIRAINARKATLQPDDYLKSIETGREEALRSGTTSILNFEAFPDLVRRVAPHPVRTWWCGEMIDLRSEIDPARVAHECAAGGRAGLAPHSPFTASRELYQRAAAVAKGRGLLLSTHLAESRDEMLLFRDGAGKLFELLRELGRPMHDAGGGTPTAQMLPLLDASWIVAHLNELSEDDFALLARAEKFTIVHCPRSHRYFDHAPFAFDRLRQLGFNICIGTDSLASNADLSLLAELRQLHAITPGDALRRVTIHAARALREPLGELRPGYYADVIAVPIESDTEVAEQVIGWEGDIPWVMIDGKVVLKNC